MSDQKQPEFKITDFEHRSALTTMLKVIQLAPMEENIKMILRMRIWGVDPAVFAPMTPFEIAWALTYGMNHKIPTQAESSFPYYQARLKNVEEDIKKAEAHGKFACEQFLVAHHAQEIVNNYNKDFNKHKNKMFPKTEFEKKRFSI